MFTSIYVLQLYISDYWTVGAEQTGLVWTSQWFAGVSFPVVQIPIKEGP